MMKNNIFYIAILAILFIGCSEDKEISTTSNNAVGKTMAEENRIKGEIPRDMEVFAVASIKDNGSLHNIIEIYKRDSEKSRGQDYEANLKNMWLLFINKKIFNEGTEAEKIFFINEQVALENNLPHFKEFYKLLTSVKSIEKKEKAQISKAFYDKNLKAIQEIKWHTPEEKKMKETELLLAWRNFATQINFNR